MYFWGTIAAQAPITLQCPHLTARCRQHLYFLFIEAKAVLSEECEKSTDRAHTA
ncbi:hypothetical protein J6590_097648, partial [Homalodisca vitripennis]